MPEENHCSFCHKKNSEVNILIAGPAVYICDKCVEICNEIIDKYKGSKKPEPLAGKKGKGKNLRKK